MANVYKIWDSTRQKRKSVLASGLEDLRKKAGDKLQMQGGSLIVVLEKDGTEIEEDEILDIFKTEVLILLGDQQSWEPDVPKDTVVIQASDVWADTQDASISKAETESTTVTTGTEIVIPSCMVSKKLTLPNFSDYVIARLNSNDSHYCWNKMIEEAAYYYMGTHPSIGKDNGTGDYKTIGQKMVQTYPSIGRPGAQPWSCFTKALSQKIRTIRHNEKTKSTFMTVPQSLSHSSPKQFKMKRGACIMNTHSEIDEHYDEHVEEMKKEFTKQKPDKVHLKQLIQQTFKQRREWIGRQPGGSSKTIVDKFPWLVIKSNMFLETKLILGVDHIQPFVDNLEKLFEAVSTLKPGGKECEDALDVIRAIENNTGFKHGKGCKTKSIVVLHEDVEEANLSKVLSSKPNTPPSLVLIFNNTELDKQYIVGDQCKIPLETDSLMEGLFLLICWYYIMDLEYPRCFSQLLGFMQQTVFKQAFLSQKSAGYLHFVGKLDKLINK